MMTRVLLVDDDVSLREALESVMTAAGHTVTVANNGLEALATAVTAPPQVIVSDVNIPILEGPDMVRMLKAVPRLSGVPVILMTGVDTDAGVSVNRLVRKPFDPRAILTSVSEVAEYASGAPAQASACRPQQPVARTLGPRARRSADTERYAARIRRGLQLVSEQDTRIHMLGRLGRDVKLAEQLYDALVASVAALFNLEATSLAMDARCPPAPDARPDCDRLELCVRRCVRSQHPRDGSEPPRRAPPAG
ncbi:response regulator [Paraburkholderia rhizosphaerae]|nr:response regulator [Paraburkholderia rhizosphaerae]